MALVSRLPARPPHTWDASRLADCETRGRGLSVRTVASPSGTTCPRGSCSTPETTAGVRPATDPRVNVRPLGSHAAVGRLRPLGRLQSPRTVWPVSRSSSSDSSSRTCQRADDDTAKRLRRERQAESGCRCDFAAGSSLGGNRPLWFVFTLSHSCPLSHRPNTFCSSRAAVL